MPRPLSYRDNSDERARAGAVTLTRMEDNAVEERRYQDAQARQEAQDARVDAREERLSAADQLESDIRKYSFEKTKALDENAKRLRVDIDRQAIEANQAMRDISLDDPDAETKIADWEVKYFRVLDPYIGDKRIQKQHELNLKLLDRRKATQEKAEALRKAQELAKAEGLKLKSVSGDTMTYGKDEPADDGKAVLSSLERERSMQARFLDRAKRIRARAKPEDTDIIRDTDADIMEAQKALGDLESQIRTRRDGGKVPPATPPVTTAAGGTDDFNSAEDFTAAFAAAAPGVVMSYKGRKFTKPQAAQ